MSKFPSHNDHEALYRWWLPVIVAHAVRCVEFAEAVQDGFVKLAEAAGRYNGTGPFINYFSLNLMSIRADTRKQAERPTTSIEALAPEGEDPAEFVVAVGDYDETDPAQMPSDDELSPLWLSWNRELQQVVKDPTPQFIKDGDPNTSPYIFEAEKPQSGPRIVIVRHLGEMPVYQWFLDYPDAGNHEPEPDDIHWRTTVDEPDGYYDLYGAATGLYHGTVSACMAPKHPGIVARPATQAVTDYNPDRDEDDDFLEDYQDDKSETGLYRAKSPKPALAGHDCHGRDVLKPRYRVFNSDGRLLGSTFHTQPVGSMWTYEPICQAWGEVYAPAKPRMKDEPLPPDEGWEPEHNVPTHEQVQHDLAEFLARLDPYQAAFVKATLSGNGPQACKEAARAAIGRAQAQRRRANVHRNAMAALVKGDLHAACQQWNFMPAPTMEVECQPA